VHVVWLVRFRHSSLTEWDEAGYIQIGVLDRVGLAHGGLVGLVRTVVHQPGEAPLVPLLAVPIYLVAGTGVFQSLFVLPVFFAILVAATYALARTLVAPAWSLLAALAVAGMPAVIDYTRLFHFAVPATACATVALWALLASDGLRRRAYALAAGAFIGLMVLSRTMTLAYLPGFALAAALQLLFRRETLRMRVTNVVLASVVATAVAATWYAPMQAACAPISSAPDTARTRPRSGHNTPSCPSVFGPRSFDSSSSSFTGHWRSHLPPACSPAWYP